MTLEEQLEDFLDNPERTLREWEELEPGMLQALEDVERLHYRLRSVENIGPPDELTVELWGEKLEEARAAQGELDAWAAVLEDRLERAQRAAAYLRGDADAPPGLSFEPVTLIAIAVVILAGCILAFLIHRDRVGLQNRRLDLLEAGRLTPEEVAELEAADPSTLEKGERTLRALALVLTASAIVGAVMTLGELVTYATRAKAKA